MQLSSNRIQGSPTTLTQNQPGGRIGSLSSYDRSSHVKTLTEGDIIRGEVTDLRNNEVEVTLEDNTRVAAFLEDSPSLSIGDTAAFRVVSLKNGAVYLKALSGSEQFLQQETILKALKEAGIAVDERNQALVRALMEQSLPIDKNSLLSLRRQCFSFPQADPKTLILMQKNHIPVTQESVSFLQQLQDGKNPLCDSLASFSGQLVRYVLGQNQTALPELSHSLFQLLENHLSACDGSMEDHSFFLSSQEDAGQLCEALDELSPFLDEEEIDQVKQQALHGRIRPDIAGPILERAKQSSYQFDRETLQKNLPEASEELSKSPEATASQEAPEKTASPFRSLFFALLGDRASDKGTNTGSLEAAPDTAKEPSRGTAGNAISELQPGNSTSDTRSDFSRQANELKHQLLSEQLPSTLELFEQEGIERILDGYDQLMASQRCLSSLLPKQQLQALAEQLKQFPLSEEFLGQLEQGTLSFREVLSQLSTNGEHASPAALKELWSHPVFQKLLSKELLHNFTLTPKQLEQGEVTNLYQRLDHFSQQLNALLGQETGSSPTLPTLGQTLDSFASLEQNLQYLELPMQLRDELKQAGLFVYTNKQNIAEHPERLRVYLKLDMEHLGSTGISLTMNGNQVQTDFFTDESNHSLLTSNFPKLCDTLMEKGFLLTPACQPVKNESPLEQQQNASVKTQKKARYTFDIRA